MFMLVFHNQKIKLFYSFQKTKVHFFILSLKNGIKSKSIYKLNKQTSDLSNMPIGIQ